ncbi:hypothetical protein tb265_14420 [Gemmatimonadetes bacterium T265]|nr:hypothetical protein tb265_14420 [Gemmatimonadetes bacterium T265]
MRVEPARPADLPAVQAAYAAARALQRARGAAVWPDFPDAGVLAEVGAGRLLRVLDDDRVAGAADTLAGVFSVTYEDAAIWGARERGAHVYLHRVARAAFRGGAPSGAGPSGRGLFGAVLAWADAHARAMGRAGVRVDTWADNAALVGYYERAGFARVGGRRLPADPRLPAHYHGLKVALLEHPCATPAAAAE